MKTAAAVSRSMRATLNVFFTNSAANTVSVVSGTDGYGHRHLTLPTGLSPSGVVVDVVTRRVFIVNRG